MDITSTATAPVPQPQPQPTSVSATSTAEDSLARAFVSHVTRVVRETGADPRTDVLNVLLEVLVVNGDHRPRVGFLMSLLDALVGPVTTVDEVLVGAHTFLAEHAVRERTVAPLVAEVLLAMTRRYLGNPSVTVAYLTCMVILDKVFAVLEAILPTPPAPVPAPMLALVRDMTLLLKDLVAPPRYLIPHYSVVVFLRNTLMSTATAIHWALEAFVEQFARRRAELQRLMSISKDDAIIGISGYTHYDDIYSSLIQITNANPAHALVRRGPAPIWEITGLVRLLAHLDNRILFSLKAKIQSSPPLAPTLMENVAKAIRHRFLWISKLLPCVAPPAGSPGPLLPANAAAALAGWDGSAPVPYTMSLAEECASYAQAWRMLADIVYYTLWMKMLTLEQFVRIVVRSKYAHTQEARWLLIQAALAPDAISELMKGSKKLHSALLGWNVPLAPSPAAAMTLDTNTCNVILEAAMARAKNSASPRKSTKAALDRFAATAPESPTYSDAAAVIPLASCYTPQGTAETLKSMLVAGTYISRDVLQTLSLSAQVHLLHSLQLVLRDAKLAVSPLATAPGAVWPPPPLLDAFSVLTRCIRFSMLDFTHRFLIHKGLPPQNVRAVSELAATRLVNVFPDILNQRHTMVWIENHLIPTRDLGVYASVHHFAMTSLARLSSPPPQGFTKLDSPSTLDVATILAIARALKARGLPDRADLDTIVEAIRPVAARSPAVLQWSSHTLAGFPPALVAELSALAPRASLSTAADSSSSHGSGSRAWRGINWKAKPPTVDAVNAVAESLGLAALFMAAADTGGPAPMDIASGGPAAPTPSTQSAGLAPFLSGVAAAEAAWTASSSSSSSSSGAVPPGSTPLVRDVLCWVWLRLVAAPSEAETLRVAVDAMLAAVPPSAFSRAVFYLAAFVAAVVDTGKGFDEYVNALDALVWELKVVRLEDLVFALVDADAHPTALTLAVVLLSQAPVRMRIAVWYECSLSAHPRGLAPYWDECSDPAGRGYLVSDVSRLQPVVTVLVVRLIETGDTTTLLNNVLVDGGPGTVLALDPEPLSALCVTLQYVHGAPGATPDVLKALARAYLPHGSSSAAALPDFVLNYVTTPTTTDDVAGWTATVDELVLRLQAHMQFGAIHEPLPPASVLYGDSQVQLEFATESGRVVTAALVSLLLAPLPVQSVVELLVRPDYASATMRARAALLGRLPTAHHLALFVKWIDELKVGAHRGAISFAQWDDAKGLLPFSRAFFVSASALSLESMPEFVRAIRPAVSITQVHVLARVFGPLIYRMTRKSNLALQLDLEIMMCILDVYGATPDQPVLSTHDTHALESVLDFIHHVWFVFGDVDAHADPDLWESFELVHSQLPGWLGRRLDLWAVAQ